MTIEFVKAFIAETALDLVFVSFILGLMTENSKRKKLNLLLMLLIFPFYVNWIKIPIWAAILVYSVFGFLSLSFLIKNISENGKNFAIKEFQKNKRKPSFGINDTLNRINQFIYVGLLSCAGLLASVFLSDRGWGAFIGIIMLLAILVVMANHFIKGHIKDTNRPDFNRIKVNLFTLFSLTLLLSCGILFALLFSVNKYFPNILTTFSFIGYFVVFPPIYISSHFLDYSRLTFFKDKVLAKLFIESILKYSILVFIITIILSDIPTVMSFAKEEDLKGMIFWMIGFVFFIAQFITIIIKKYWLFKFESQLADPN